VESLLPGLAAQAPIGTGLLTWFMMRGMRGSEQPTLFTAPSSERLAAFQIDQTGLCEHIAARPREDHLEGAGALRGAIAHPTTPPPGPADSLRA